MASRFMIWGARRALAIRSQPSRFAIKPLRSTASTIRFYADDADSKPPNPVNGAKAENSTSTSTSTSASTSDSSNDEVAEESADELAQSAFENIVGASQESLIDSLDDATLEQILYGGRPVTSTREDALTAAQEEALYRVGVIPSPEEAEAQAKAEAEAEALIATSEANGEPPSLVPEGGELQNLGHKFGLPKKPYPEGFHLRKRYHPVLDQITRLLMRDGKLSAAQRNMALVMNFLRTAPAPIYSPKFPLLPGTPPSSHLPLNPVLYITVAIDSVAPLLKVRNVAGAGGGGRALELPVPLAVRQRRRVAFQWILDVINKKPSKGSGRTQFAHRIAEEIIAVVEGRSSVWEKRKLVHKLGTAARANIRPGKFRVKKRK